MVGSKDDRSVAMKKFVLVMALALGLIGCLTLETVEEEDRMGDLLASASYTDELSKVFDAYVYSTRRLQNNYTQSCTWDYEAQGRFMTMNCPNIFTKSITLSIFFIELDGGTRVDLVRGYTVGTGLIEGDASEIIESADKQLHRSN